MASLNVSPVYQTAGAEPTADFFEAASRADQPLRLDPVAIASFLSFQYVIDGHTLISQVRRRPWQESVTGPGNQLDQLPQHRCQLMSSHAVARELLQRLRTELVEALGHAERITILLSGGLDSRLAGAVCTQLARQGRLTDRIRAVTWGRPNSRDLHYGRRVANHLKIQWTPIELNWRHLDRNIDTAAGHLGALVSPVHLHAMTSVSELEWSKGDVILASTLGNGVGRGQYLYRHLSYTRPIEPANWLNFMQPEVFAKVRPELTKSLRLFRGSLGRRLPVAVHECEMQAHYISGLLLHAFSILSRTAAPVHQTLSHPDTYGFLWSLSPTLRTQSTYRIALQMCDPELADIPDALSNRKPKRFSQTERNSLSPYVHRYPSWITHELAERIDLMLDREWFDDTRIFSGKEIRGAWERLQSSRSPHSPTAYLLIWLCTFRRFVQDLESRGISICREGETHPPPPSQRRAGTKPPWGFAGRGPDSLLERIRSWPQMTENLLHLHCRNRS